MLTSPIKLRPFITSQSPHHHTSLQHHWKTSKLRNCITSPLNYPSNSLSNTHSHWPRKLERFEYTKHRSPHQLTIAITAYRSKLKRLSVNIDSNITNCQISTQSSHQSVNLSKTAAKSPTLSTDPQLSHLFNLINLSKS